MSDWNTLLPTSHVDTYTRDRLPPPAQWPVFLADRPELAYPDILNVAVALVDEHVLRGQGDRVALHGQSPTTPAQPFDWTYAELQNQVDRLAHVLTRDMGLVSGNRVLLRGGNSPMMAACLLACFKAGLVAVPTMPLLRSGELAAIINQAHIGAALCDSLLADELRHCMTPGHPHHTPGLQQLISFRTSTPEGLEARM